MRVIAAPSIVMPALLLQSNDEAAWSALGFAVAFLCAVIAILLIGRFRLWKCPAEPSGVQPRDPAFGAAAMVLFVLAGGLGAAAGAGLGIADDAYAREARGALGNILQIAVVVLAARTALFVAAERKPASAAKAMGIGVLAFMLVMPIVMALAMAINSLLVKLGYPAAPQASHETLAILLERKDPWLSTLTFAHVTLLVPIAEEGGWRGLLQPSFRRAGLSGLASACLTSLLFAAVHWTMLPADGRVTGLSMLFTLSMAMGILRERTGGIVAPITVHALFNAVNVAVALS